MKNSSMKKKAGIGTKVVATTSTRCVQCGRVQKPDEGFWMLCESCGTFRCPSCYGNLLEKTECPACRDREEAEQIVAFLFETKKSLSRGRKAS